MFIERLHYPSRTRPVSRPAGAEPDVLFCTIVEPLITALPLLVGAEGERVLVVSSPLSEVLDEAIGLHRHHDYPDRVVVDQQHQAFVEAVRASLAQVMAKLEQIEFAALDEDEEEG